MLLQRLFKPFGSCLLENKKIFVNEYISYLNVNYKYNEDGIKNYMLDNNDKYIEEIIKKYKNNDKENYNYLLKEYPFIKYSFLRRKEFNDRICIGENILKNDLK